MNRGPRAQRLLLVAAAVLVLAAATLAARWRPLWFDELFTLYVAQEPTLAATMRALLAGADTNPPLDYLLRHLSLAAFGASPVAFRLPSALAFVAGLAAAYCYVRRRTGFAAAAAAFLWPIGTAAAYFSHEGRGYALLFASAPLALVAWQRAVDRPRDPLRLALLTAALCVGPYAHYYGVLSLAPPAAGEAWRSVARRRLEPGIVVAFAVAGLLLVGLLPFARNATGMSGAFWAAHFTLGDAFDYYRGFLQYAHSVSYYALAAMVAVVAVLAAAGRAGRVPPAPGHEILAAVVLAATPLTAFLLAATVTGALTSRYAIGLVPGLAIIAGYLLAIVERWRPAVAQVAVVVLAASCLAQLASTAWSYRGLEPIAPEMRQLLHETTLPVAFDSPHDYLRYVHYEPSIARDRFHYPMDPATAAALRGINNDEIALRGLARIAPLNVSDYADFTAGHREFIAIYSLDFAPALTRALPTDGYCYASERRIDRDVVLHVKRDCS